MKITKASEISDFVAETQSKWIAHITRCQDTAQIKKLMFNTEKNRRRGPKFKAVFDRVISKSNMAVTNFFSKCHAREW